MPYTNDNDKDEENMSWISNMEGNPDPNFKDDGPKVPDPAIPDRMVSTKRANQPFLA